MKGGAFPTWASLCREAGLGLLVSALAWVALALVFAL
jgi:hypothetical protein